VCAVTSLHAIYFAQNCVECKSTYIINFLFLLKVARRISPRVDDVVRSMYPPLDARLLEARTAALALAVTHLALVTRYGCSIGRSSRRLAWIDQALTDMEPHLLVRHCTPALTVAFTCSVYTINLNICEYHLGVRIVKAAN
jgi:hypothetical protein